MSTFIKGDVNILYVHDDTIWRPVACLTANSLSQTRNIIESQTKCEPGVVQKDSGSLAYEISAEGKYIDTTSVGSEITKASHDYLFGLMNAGTSFYWKLDTGLTDTTAYYGTAILGDLSWDAAAGDEHATFSATLAGSGSIVTTDPS